MDGESTKAFYLSVNELLILLHKAEINGLMFPTQITNASVSGRDLKQAMSRLVYEGILVDGNDNTNKFEFSNTAQQWLEILKTSDISVVVNGEDDVNYSYYYYLSKSSMLQLNIDKHSKDMVRMEVADRSEMIGRIRDIDDTSKILFFRRGEDTPRGEEISDI